MIVPHVGAGMFHHDVLASLAARCDSYLEIGVQEGLSAIAVAKVNPSIGMTLCDTWGREHGGTGRGGPEHVERALMGVGHAGRRVYLNGDSKELVPRLTEQFDLVHVDGDHSHDGAYADLRNVFPLVRRYLVVHDFQFGDVRNACCALIGETRDAWKSIQLTCCDHWTLVLMR